MTAAVWDELAPAPEPPRDRWGRYLITPAAGGKPTGHIRATTFAKTVAEESALAAWKQRMTALGLAARPDLLAAVATTNPDDKRTLDDICGRALEHGGGTARRDIGTAIHAGTERHDKGQPHGLPDPYGADVDAYAAALDRIGATINPAHIERICVVADLTVAGTFDRLLTVDGRLPVTDIKTGANTYGAQEWAIQLALYAHADTLWTPIADRHEPMPPVDQDRGLILHVPAGSGRCDVYTIDIAAGWEMVQTCATVRAWRKRRDLLVKVESATAPEAPTVVDLAPAPAPAVDLLAPPPAAPPRTAGPIEQAAHQDRIHHLRGRLAAIVDQPDAMASITAAMPAGLPTFRQHTDGAAVLEPHHLDTWERLITTAEAVIEAPFVAERDPAGPLATDDPRIADLRARWMALPDDLRAGVEQAATDADIPKLTSGKATVRHLDAVLTLVTDAENTMRDRAMLATAHIAALPDTVTARWIADTIGADRDTPLARLTAAQLDMLGDLPDAVLVGILTADDRGGLTATSPVDHLVEHFGGKRPALAAAKQAAADLGLDFRPTRADDLATAPLVLVARLALTDPPTSGDVAA